MQGLSFGQSPPLARPLRYFLIGPLFDLLAAANRISLALLAQHVDFCAHPIHILAVAVTPF